MSTSAFKFNNMAGTVLLNLVSSEELATVTEEIQQKLQNFIETQEAENDEIKSKYERLRVNSGNSSFKILICE